jgi:hypothetical protein
MNNTNIDNHTVNTASTIALASQRPKFFCSLLVAVADAIRVVNTTPRLIALSIAAALTGCATADFTSYEGTQQNWPTARGTFVRTVNSYNGPGRSGTGRQYTLPVYFGPPDKPYSVLGYIDVETPVGRLFEGSAQTSTLKPAVRVAGQHGANAVVLLASGTNVIGSATFNSGQWGSNTTTTGGVYGNYFNAQSQTTGSGFSSSITTPIRQGYARVIAIKFL